jgi:uncharacterized membrane protein YozB (DUF420 family)
MAGSVVVASPSTPDRRLAYDRRFYGGMAIAMAATVLVGFGPTYYLPLLGAGELSTITGRPVKPLVHLHGVLFTGWVALFIAQTALVATRRVRVHQRMGIAGAILAAAMVVVGARTAVAGAAEGTAPPGVDALVFLVVPLTDVVLFAGFVGAALWQRRNREAHKRLMLLAYISIMAAAVARLPGLLPHGPLVFFGLTFLFLVAAIVYDAASRRRVHPVYIWGGALLVASVPLRLMLSETAAWRSFAQLVTR